MTQSRTTDSSFHGRKWAALSACLISCAMAVAAQEPSVPNPIEPIPLNAGGDATARAMDAAANTQKDFVPQLTYRVPRGNERYLLGPGDTVLITVFRYPELSRAARIEGDGTIRVPLIHSDIHASCLTTDQLAAEVAKHYLEYLKDPQVDVSIRDYSSEPVAVVGAVNKPGSFALQRRARLREILAFAGGPSPVAGRLVQIMHDEPDGSGCAAGPTNAHDGDAPQSALPTTSSAEANRDGAVPQETPNPGAASGPSAATSISKEASPSSGTKPVEVTNTTDGPAVPSGTPVNAAPAPGITYVDLVELMQGGGADPYIRPGDIINIPEASSAFVIGDVNHPTVVPLNKPIMLSRAIALAGGPTSDARSSRVRIVRYIDTKGGNTEIVVNLNDIYKNKREDIALRAGDIVQVPGSTAKSIMKSIMWLGSWWGVYNAYNIFH